MTEEQKTKSPFGVELVHVTESAEQLIAYCARVSSPNQEKAEFDKLLAYCIKNQHWSIFEMASMCVEIRTSRAIAQQILRHRSFSFQEFSQRYAEVSDFQTYEARRQDTKNRQNSIDDLDSSTVAWFKNAQKEVWDMTNQFYQHALRLGVAKECARFLLPLNVETKLYMHGTIRSWIHYLNLRCANGTQKEHKDIADAIKVIFIEHFPACAYALGWTRGMKFPPVPSPEELASRYGGRASDYYSDAQLPEPLLSVNQLVDTTLEGMQDDVLVYSEDPAIQAEFVELLNRTKAACASRDITQIQKITADLESFYARNSPQAVEKVGDNCAVGVTSADTNVESPEPVIIPTATSVTGDK